MEKEQTSPWLAVTIGILGMVVGYSVVLAQQDRLVFATGGGHCPARAMQHNA